MWTWWSGPSQVLTAIAVTSVISSVGGIGASAVFGVSVLYVYLAGVLSCGVEPGLCRGEVVESSSKCLAALTFGNMVICFLIMG